MSTETINDNADLNETGKPKASLFDVLRAQAQRSAQTRDSAKEIAKQYEDANRLFGRYERLKDLIPTYRLNIVPAQEEELVEKSAAGAAEALSGLAWALETAIQRTLGEMSRRTNLSEIADEGVLDKLGKGELSDAAMAQYKEWMLMQ